MAKYNVDATADLIGLDATIAAINNLHEKIQEVRTLCNELTSALDSLEIEIKIDGNAAVRTDI